MHYSFYSENCAGDEPTVMHCAQEGCDEGFSTAWDLLRHVQSKHRLSLYKTAEKESSKSSASNPKPTQQLPQTNSVGSDAKTVSKEESPPTATAPPTVATVVLPTAAASASSAYVAPAGPTPGELKVCLINFLKFIKVNYSLGEDRAVINN